MNFYKYFETHLVSPSYSPDKILLPVSFRRPLSYLKLQMFARINTIRFPKTCSTLAVSFNPPDHVITKAAASTKLIANYRIRGKGLEVVKSNLIAPHTG